MKKIIMCGIAAVIALTSATSVCAQTNNANDPVIWDYRARYFNIAYAWQTINIGGLEYKSDLAASISWGKQYYLHRQPIAGMMKFAIDYTWIDLNYASYKFLTVSDAEIYTQKAMQAEYAMSVGPSFTINPFDAIKVCVYYRVSPSLTLMKGDDFNIGYATYMNAGASFAWKVLSVGAEYRWGNPKYKALSSQPAKTSAIRLYLGFRF